MYLTLCDPVDCSSPGSSVHGTFQARKISKWILKKKDWCSYLLGSVGKESTCNAGDPGSIPGLGRSPGEGTGYPPQYSWASLVAQLVKNLPAMRETWVQSLGWEDLLEKEMATHSSILAWRITVHGVAKSRTQLSDFHFHSFYHGGSESEVAQSCPTPRESMDCSLPGSSVHGIFQARVLEWRRRNNDLGI